MNLLNISSSVARKIYLKSRERFLNSFSMVSQVKNTGLNKEGSEIYRILESRVEKEKKKDPNDPSIHSYGRVQQIERIASVAEYCAQKYEGDFVEIGCYIGQTTRELARVAKAYGRRVIAVDPWEQGTQDCNSNEYDRFLESIKPYASVVDIVRRSSLDKKTKAAVKSRKLCFASVDGLHTYQACLSDILTVKHTLGIIAVDDVSWDSEVMLAFERGAYLTARTPIWQKLCREGYLVKKI